jgi:SAM-dependent methyltransferase
MDLTAQLVRCVEDLELALIPRLDNDEAEKKQVEGQYDHIPLPADQFVKQLNRLFKIAPHLFINRKFVDVGCGVGTKLLLSRGSFGGNYQYGIEYSREYVDVAKKLNPDATIIHNDAMKETYGRYDVIYFYCPFQNKAKQALLEELIVDTAKPGAYILANRKQHPDLWKSSKVKHCWGDVIYQKLLFCLLDVVAMKLLAIMILP